MMRDDVAREDVDLYTSCDSTEALTLLARWLTRILRTPSYLADFVLASSDSILELRVTLCSAG
jgi:hypothetical protein